MNEKQQKRTLTGVTPMDVQVLLSAGHLRDSEFPSVTSEFPGRRI